MLAYRIAHKKYSSSLKPSGMEGRWNSRGKKVIYAGTTLELAFLESMIRRQGTGFSDNFRTMIIEIPDTLKSTTIRPSTLPKNWRDPKDLSKCQSLGDAWYEKGETAVLKVPSALIPDSYNVVISTEHPGFKKIKLLAATDLVPDPRIDEILRRYKK